MRSVHVLLLFAGACSLGGGVEPVPFRGRPPRSILVAPAVSRLAGGVPLEEEVAVELARAAGPALRRRGYRSPEVAGAHGELRRAGIGLGAGIAAEDLEKVAQRFGVDAVLLIGVEEWDAEWDGTLRRLQYVLDYRIVSTAAGAMAWQHRAGGSYERPLPGKDWSETFDEVGPALRRPPDAGPVFHSVREVAAAIHRGAFERLSEAGGGGN